MKKIRISMMALFAVAAVGMSFTTFSEPGEPGMPSGTVVCTFHGGTPWAFLQGDGPFKPKDCTERPNWPFAKAEHESRTSHHASDCIVLSEPDN